MTSSPDKNLPENQEQTANTEAPTVPSPDAALGDQQSQDQTAKQPDNKPSKADKKASKKTDKAGKKDATVAQEQQPDTDTAKAKDTAAKQSEPKAKPTDTPEKAAKASSSSNGIATLALVVALATAGFSGWHWWQSQQQLPQTQPMAEAATVETVDLSPLEQQLAQHNEQLSKLQQQFSQLPSAQSFADNERALTRMQSAHQAFSQRFEQAFGNTRQDWRLAEAEHLLRMAILRLSALQDINSARHLVEATDQILFEQDDVAAYAAREAIAKALAELNAMPKLDRSGVFLRLNALQTQVSQLDQLMPGFDVKDKEKQEQQAFWREWADELSSYIRIDFESEEQIRPLLSSQEVTHIRLALSLALEQAQWAALNGQTEVYDSALEQATKLLDYYFPADHFAASNLKQQLNELAGQQISQAMPDIKPALLTLQAYIHERTMEYRTRSEVQQ